MCNYNIEYGSVCCLLFLSVQSRLVIISAVDYARARTAASIRASVGDGKAWPWGLLKVTPSSHTSRAPSRRVPHWIKRTQLQYFKEPLWIQWHATNKHLNQWRRKKKATKSYWPSLLITRLSMAQLTTWQACLAKEMSVLIWEAGARDGEEGGDGGGENRAAHTKLQSMNCHTTSGRERAIWPARFQYLTPQWHLDPITAEHSGKPGKQSSNQTGSDQTRAPLLTIPPPAIDAPCLQLKAKQLSSTQLASGENSLFRFVLSTIEQNQSCVTHKHTHTYILVLDDSSLTFLIYKKNARGVYIAVCVCR